MTTAFSNQPILEPDEQFDAACLAFIERWEHGELPASQTLEHLQELKQSAYQNGELANQGRAEHLLGYVHHYMGNLTTSIEHYERARRLFLRCNNRRRMAMMDLNQGENYRLKGEYQRARRLYHSAYEASTELDDLRMQATSLTNEGLVLISIKDYKSAKLTLDKAYALTEHYTPEMAGRAGLRCEIYQGLALVALFHEDAPNAWNYARQSLSNALEENQAISIGFAWRILGDVVTLMETPPSDPELPDNPDDYYRNALDSFRDIHAEGEVGRTLFSHAKSLAQRGRKRPAAQLFREAMVIFTRLGMIEDAAKAAEAQLRVI